MKHLKRFNEDKFSLKNEDIEDELRYLFRCKYNWAFHISIK